MFKALMLTITKLTLLIYPRSGVLKDQDPKSVIWRYNMEVRVVNVYEKDMPHMPERFTCIPGQIWSACQN